MTGRSSKQKGSRRERELVARCLARGIHARRVPLSGAVSGFKGDVQMWVPYGRLVVEVKARKNGEGFKTLEDWLGDQDILVLWRDRAEPMVTLRLDLFLELIGGSDA